MKRIAILAVLLSLVTTGVTLANATDCSCTTKIRVTQEVGLTPHELGP